MIICLNLESLSDADLSRIHSEVWYELSKRSTERMKDIPLNDEEKSLIDHGEFTKAIKSFRDRNNCILMDWILTYGLECHKKLWLIHNGLEDSIQKSSLLFLIPMDSPRD